MLPFYFVVLAHHRCFSNHIKSTTNSVKYINAVSLHKLVLAKTGMSQVLDVGWLNG